MKKLILLALLAIPITSFSQQRKATDNVYGTTQTWEVKKFTAARKLATGGGLIAAGTVLTAGSAIHSVNITTNNEKTVIYVAAGTGAALAIVGGILFGKGVKGLSRQIPTSGLKFSGSSLVFRF